MTTISNDIAHRLINEIYSFTQVELLTFWSELGVIWPSSIPDMLIYEFFLLLDKIEPKDSLTLWSYIGNALQSTETCLEAIDQLKAGDRESEMVQTWQKFLHASSILVLFSNHNEHKKDNESFLDHPFSPKLVRQLANECFSGGKKFASQGQFESAIVLFGQSYLLFDSLNDGIQPNDIRKRAYSLINISVYLSNSAAHPFAIFVCDLAEGACQEFAHDRSHESLLDFIEYLACRTDVMASAGCPEKARQATDAAQDLLNELDTIDDDRALFTTIRVQCSAAEQRFSEGNRLQAISILNNTNRLILSNAPPASSRLQIETLQLYIKLTTYQRLEAQYTDARVSCQKASLFIHQYNQNKDISWVFATIQAKIQLALLDYAEGFPESAIKITRSAIETLNQTDADQTVTMLSRYCLTSILGRLEYERGNNDTALTLLSTTVDTVPEDIISSGDHTLIQAALFHYITLATILADTADYENAQLMADRADQILINNTQHNYDWTSERLLRNIIFARLMSIKGNLLEACELLSETHEHCSNSANNKRYDILWSRLNVSMNYAQVLLSLGDTDRANGIAKDILAELQSQIGKSSPVNQWAPLKARAHLLIGTIASGTGKTNIGLHHSKQAHLLYASEALEHREDLLPNYASTLLLLGHCQSFTESECSAAAATLKSGIAFLKILIANNRVDLSLELARGVRALGQTHNNQGNKELAIEYFKKAETLYLADEVDRQFDAVEFRAVNRLDLGAHLIGTDNKAAQGWLQLAIEDYQALDHWLPIEAERSLLYRNCSELLEQWPSPLAFALDCSRNLQTMLELCPENTENEHDHWQQMRRNFIRFHANWLQYLGVHQYIDDIPYLIAAIQGNEVLTDIIDSLNSVISIAGATSEELESLAQYQQIRIELRTLIESGTALDTDREEYRRLALKLSQIRTQARNVKGFETLQADASAFNLHRLRSVLPDNHLLGVMIQVGQKNALWLTSNDGRSVLIPLENMDPIAKKTSELVNLTTASARHLRRRGLSVTKPDDAMISERKLQDHWLEIRVSMEQAFWNDIDIRDVLDMLNIDVLHLCTMGSLHTLPLGAGQPDNLTVCNYPGLTYFALATGLLSSSPESTSENTVPLGVISHNPGAASGYALTAVDSEIRRLKEQWGSDLYHNLAVPDDFPNAPIRIQRLHFAGHSGVDPQRPSSTAMHVGQDSYLGANDILAGHTIAAHAMLNTCTAGAITDDIRGTPLGLVTALLRQGCKSVVAATVPINDFLAEEIGVKWYELGATGEDADGLDDAMRFTQLRKAMPQLYRVATEKFLSAEKFEFGESNDPQQIDTLVEKIEKSNNFATATPESLALVVRDNTEHSSNQASKNAFIENPDGTDNRLLPSILASELYCRRLYVGKIAGNNSR